MKTILLTHAILLGSTSLAWAQAPAGPATLDEVVVTAERRESTVQKSSLSIQVLSKDEVETVRRTNDLNALAPGIQIGSSGPSPQVYIRGVGDAARNARAQTGVVFSIDGVPLARPSAATPNFFDLERIEVLKGPQGTLYGRNSSGGAINLISARPRLNEYSGNASIEAGNFNLVAADAAVNLGLSSTTALRIAGKVVDRDGYLSDGGQDQRSKAARARLLWEPSDAISVLLNADVAHVGGKGSGVTVLPVYGGDPWRANTDPRGGYPFSFSFGPGTLPYTAPNDRKLDADMWGLSAEINADLGFATLTAIPAYRTQKQETVAYSSNFRFGEALDAKASSLEVRLANDDNDAFQWILGAFYYIDQYTNAIFPVQGSLSTSLKSDEEVESKSVFASTTYSPVSGLRLVGGLRYTTETSGGTFVNGSGSEPEVRFVQIGPVVSFKPSKVSQVNWKAGIEYDLLPTSMIYANAGTGFKAGGTNITQCGGPSFEPETVTQYLAGSRNRFFGNTLQVNGEAFLLKTKGQQVSAITPTCNAAGVPGAQLGLLIFNVGKATVYGANVDIAWRPTEQDKFHFFAEYSKGTADDFVFSQSGAGAYAPAQRSLCSATAGTGSLFTINCSGQDLPRVPEWTLQADYQHTFSLSNEGKIVPRVSAQYVTKRWLDVGYSPNAMAPAYFVANAEIAYTAPNDRWSLTGYVNNLTNEPVYTSGVSIAANAPNGTRYYTANIEAPRMYGVRLGVNF